MQRRQVVMKDVQFATLVTVDNIFRYSVIGMVLMINTYTSLPSTLYLITNTVTLAFYGIFTYVLLNVLQLPRSKCLIENQDIHLVI